jgi:hypothetical protein
MVAKRHKITNVPLFKKIWDIIFFFWDNKFLSHFSGHFEGASTFLTPKLSLETAQKVIVPQKKIMSRIFLNSGTLIVIQERILPRTSLVEEYAMNTHNESVWA